MALKAKVTKAEFDGLNEAFKTEYTVNAANADEYELAIEGAEDVTGLKSALQKERERANAAEKASKKFDGLDPDVARKALADQQEAEQKRLAAEGNFTALKDQLVQQQKRETDALNEKLAAKDKAVAKLLIENVAKDALTAAKVKGTGKAVLPQIIAHTKVEYDEASGTYKTVVVDANGNKRISNAKGDDMTIADLVNELKADPEFAVNFEPSGQSGSGKGQERSGGAPLTGNKTVSRSDSAAMSANLADIANGKVTVTD